MGHFSIFINKKLSTDAIDCFSIPTTIRRGLRALSLYLMKYRTSSLIIAAAAVLPSVASAQNQPAGSLNFLTNMVRQFSSIVDMAMPIAVGILFIAFIVGLVKYVSGSSSGNSEGKSEGSKIMIAGVVALFVVTSIWGIIKFMQNFFGLDNSGSINVPTVGGMQKGR